LFSDGLNAVISVLAFAVLGLLLMHFVKWGLLDAAWPGAAAQACHDAGGACWAFLGQKYRQILFGIYPPDEQWRPALASAVLLLLALVSLPPRNWRHRLLLAWVSGIAAAVLLMGGGGLGLAPVPTASWGGLPVTLLLAVGALGLGLPLGIVLALGRRAALPVPRWLCIGVIELIRGVPLASLLFVTSILLPLMLPQGLSIDGLLRATAALVVCSAAYLAEIVRAGLQSVPRGQLEAAQALGLSWWSMTRLVVLPQALRQVIPPLTNTAIVMIKNTSLVLIIGLFDLISSARSALIDPAWPTPYAETYGFVAFVYFLVCFGLSRYSLWLERRLLAGGRP
jgi:general L-amino acid transport system permease protein